MHRGTRHGQAEDHNKALGEITRPSLMQRGCGLVTRQPTLNGLLRGPLVAQYNVQCIHDVPCCMQATTGCHQLVQCTCARRREVGTQSGTHTNGNAHVRRRSCLRSEASGGATRKLRHNDAQRVCSGGAAHNVPAQEVPRTSDGMATHSAPTGTCHANAGTQQRPLYRLRRCPLAIQARR